MIKTYIDTVLSLPWNTYTEDNTDIEEARKMLDKTHYGSRRSQERV